MIEKKIRQVLRHGIWLYGGVTKSDVWIVRQNYVEGPKPDEELTPGYPPTDPGYPPTDNEGCFYFSEYSIPGAGGGGGGEVFGSSEDAIRNAESIVGLILWDE